MILTITRDMKVLCSCRTSLWHKTSVILISRALRSGKPTWMEMTWDSRSTGTIEHSNRKLSTTMLWILKLWKNKVSDTTTPSGSQTSTKRVKWCLTASIWTRPPSMYLGPRSRTSSGRHKGLSSLLSKRERNKKTWTPTCKPNDCSIIGPGGTNSTQSRNNSGTLKLPTTISLKLATKDTKWLVKWRMIERGSAPSRSRTALTSSPSGNKAKSKEDAPQWQLSRN